jgi:hypothetical protein
VDEASLAPIEESLFDESTRLLDQILQDNRQNPSLQALRQQALREDSELTLEDDLLLYSGRLLVPLVLLRTELIREAYNQVSTAHLGRDKTYQLLRP